MKVLEKIKQFLQEYPKYEEDFKQLIRIWIMAYDKDNSEAFQKGVEIGCDFYETVVATSYRGPSDPKLKFAEEFKFHIAPNLAELTQDELEELRAFAFG